MKTLNVGNSTLQYNIDGQMPGMTVYNIKLISGTWPSNTDLSNAIDPRYLHFGGKIYPKDEKNVMMGVYID
jgi:hypothetical protein